MDSCRRLLRCSRDRVADIPVDHIRVDTESASFSEVVTRSIQQSDYVVQSGDRAVKPIDSWRTQGESVDKTSVALLLMKERR
jgi:hypothetical protein